MPRAGVGLRRGAVGGSLALALALGTAACSDAPPAAPSAAANATSAATSTSAAPSLATTAEVVAASQKAVGAATSAHVTGQVSRAGRKMSIDLAGSRDGKNQSLTVGLAEGRITVLTVDSSFYLTADAAYWKSQGLGATGAKIAGRYLTAPTAEVLPMADFSLPGLLKTAFGGAEVQAMATSSAPAAQEQVDGVVAYALRDSGVVLYIAADSLLPVRLVAPEGAGTLNFTEWNAVTPVTAPDPSEIVDPSALP